MPRLFITAGHSHQSPGAIANGLMESMLTIELRNLITKECVALGAEVINDNDNDALITVISKIKNKIKPDDILIDIHFNAGPQQVSGVEAFYSKVATAQEKELAGYLCQVVSQVLGTNNRGPKQEDQSQHNSLGILHTGGKSVLLEVCFVSNKDEIKKYLKLKSQIAKKIAQVLVPLPKMEQILALETN
jgi:N-acetylmuramoyl-L-alanine amidase